MIEVRERDTHWPRIYVDTPTKFDTSYVPEVACSWSSHAFGSLCLLASAVCQAYHLYYCLLNALSSPSCIDASKRRGEAQNGPRGVCP